MDRYVQHYWPYRTEYEIAGDQLIIKTSCRFYYSSESTVSLGKIKSVPDRVRISDWRLAKVVGCLVVLSLVAWVVIFVNFKTLPGFVDWLWLVPAGFFLTMVLLLVFPPHLEYVTFWYEAGTPAFSVVKGGKIQGLFSDFIVSLVEVIERTRKRSA